MAIKAPCILLENTFLLYNGKWHYTIDLLIQLLCLCGISNILICLVKSEVVKQEVSATQWYFPLKSKWVFFLSFLNGPTPASFLFLFSFFSITILQKNCRPQRDSNSDRWSRRRARWPLDHHHGPSEYSLILLKLNVNWVQCDLMLE